TILHETLNGVEVHRVGSYGTVFSTSIAPRYLRATRSYPADIWHSHSPNPLADTACLLGNRLTPLLISYHSDVIRQRGLMRLYAPLQQAVLRRAAGIVVAAPQILEFSTWLRPFRDKCRVIPFGLNLARFEKTPSIERRTAELRSTAHGKTILLNVGR